MTILHCRLTSLAGLTALLLLTALPGRADQANPALRYRAAQGAGHKVQVDRGTVAASRLAAGGAQLIADYGTFQLFEASAAALDDLGGAGVENRDDQNLIRLNAGAVDTRSAIARAGRRLASATFSGRQLHLVQFAGPIKAEWLAALGKTGVQVVDYIPENAYLVYGTAAALQRLQQLSQTLPALQFEGAYLAGDRIHPRLAGGGKAARATRGADAATHVQMQLVADKEANALTLSLIDTLKLEPIYRTLRTERYVNVVVKLAPDAVDVLALQPEVISIHPYTIPHKMDERQDIIVAGQLVGTQPSGPGYLAWLASKGFTQQQFTDSGLVVDVTDSGIDNGTTAANHFGLYLGGTTSGASRVVYNRLEGTANASSTLEGCDGHGNLNSHIIAGNVSLSGSPHTDAAGYRYGLGVAPFVKVGSSVIFDPSTFTNPNYPGLLSRSYNSGARISADSWGADNAGGYDVDAQIYDGLVRDAQPTGAAFATAGNQQMTVVFAAGNAGSGAQTVGSPGTAKNVITVGAAENVRSHATAAGGGDASGNDGCVTPDTEANSADDMATFSSRGPCEDGRVKPEIVAPGTHITGGVGQAVRTMSGSGKALDCFDGTGVCGLPGGGSVGSVSNFFPLGQQWYSTSSGTSHSTPAVAGGAALVYQWFLNHASAAPSPAMVKAYLVNAARYMSGTGAGDSLPSSSQGMGGMNLGQAFDDVPRLLRDQIAGDTFTASGQQRVFTGRVASSTNAVRVTLSWTDAPGSTSGSASQNNLDLTVTVGGTTYKGNVFSGASSTAGGSADPRNNTESVFLPAGVSGPMVVTIRASNISADGVPNSGTTLDQDFALVVYNVAQQDLPVIASAGSQLTTEDCGVGNGAIDPGEHVTFAFALQNLGTAGTSNVVATLLASGGVTLPSAAKSYGALAVGGSSATNSFSFTVSGVCGGSLTATLALQDGTNDLGMIDYGFRIGGQVQAFSTNSNTSAIAITDNSSASPYPSTITVSGMPGTVSKAVVTLVGFSHTWTADVDAVLVGPDGARRVGLLGAVGGTDGASGATLVFDDSASGPIEGAIVSGTYQPSGSVASMPSPAPAAPYATALSEFAGASPNGTWSLYVSDAAPDDFGSIAQGWKLALTTAEAQCCASNQPPILATIGSKSVVESNTLTFAVSAADPSDSDPITLSITNLPAGATFSTTNGNGSFNWVNAGPIGVYTSTVYATDKDGSDSEAVLITVSAAGSGGAATNYFVNFEGPGETKTAYASSNVTLSGISWTLTDALIGSQAGDRFNGTRSARLQSTSGVMTMQGDFVGGATNIQFLCAKYGTDANSELALDYSADSGANWVNAGTVTVSTNTLTAFSTNVSVTGNIRLRIRKTTGSGSNRASVDDIRIFGSGGGGTPAQTPPVLAAIGAKSVVISNTLQFAVSAVPTDGDQVTLSVSNLPAGAEFTSTNENGTFLWTSAAPVGVYTSTFYAADNDGVVSQTATITVANPVNASGAGGVWINELHYDNNGADADEGVEVAGPAGTSLTGFSVVAYNGADGVNYATTNLSGMIDDEGCGYGAVWLPMTVLQNGSPDGVALVSDGTNVVQFLSYEGTFTATKGAADGLTSVDIGVSESGTLAEGESLQLTGTGTNDAGFAWTGPVAASMGVLNADQFITGCGAPPPSVTITTTNQTVPYAVASITVDGTANAAVAGEMWWTNSLTGLGSTIPAATSWSIATIALAEGVNPITVAGTNSAGTVASASVTITRLAADSDHDGIDDAWEQQYFGNLTTADATSDWDRDGFIDRNEYLAGSVPTNSESLLRAVDAGRAPGGSGFVLQWMSEPNRFYSVLRSGRLADGFTGLASNLPAELPMNTYTDLTATTNTTYYRIQLELP